MTTLAKASNKPKTDMLTVAQWLFGIITVIHLFIFIKYTTTVDGHVLVKLSATLDWRLKTAIPIALLVTLSPDVRRVLDRLISPTTVNRISMVLIAISVGLQIATVPGQAWSTLAFALSLILLLYNNLVIRHNASSIAAWVLSFMVVWLGWVVFEAVFHTGQWLIHPNFYNYDWKAYCKIMMQLVMWATAPALYIYCALSNKLPINPKMRLDNRKLFFVLIGIAVVAVAVWFKTGMLVPIPVGSDGRPYVLEISYMSIEHLEFSISRLSQISIMTAAAILFFRKGDKEQ